MRSCLLKTLCSVILSKVHSPEGTVKPMLELENHTDYCPIAAVIKMIANNADDNHHDDKSF